MNKKLPDLILPVKACYFEQIKAGTKPEEFRLVNDYWRRRLEGKTFARVIVTLGYPSKDDAGRRLVFPWRGLTVKTITHEHFGVEPVQVFAIKVGEVLS